MTDPSLRSSEWFLVSSFLLLLFSFTMIAQINRVSSESEIKELRPQEKIFVTIQGAVNKPGTYEVFLGTSVSDVLKKARPLRSANLRGMDLGKRLEVKTAIEIESLSAISVHVEGAVKEPKELFLPLNSRFCDLKKKLEFSERADLSVFKSRRYLKDGERIWVPEKRSEKGVD